MTTATMKHAQHVEESKKHIEKKISKAKDTNKLYTLWLDT
jgi:hypothetical protein